MKRFKRTAVLAAMFTGVGVLFQLGIGGCIATSLNVGLSAIDFCSLLGSDCTLGPIAPCGDPRFPQDDLLVDCPFTTTP